MLFNSPIALPVGGGWDHEEECWGEDGEEDWAGEDWADEDWAAEGCWDVEEHWDRYGTIKY